MKHVFIVIFAAWAFCALSCSEQNLQIDITRHQETISFSASIDLPGNTKASLNDHAIEWGDDEHKDHIGVANDVNDEIEDCTITRDAEDHTKGSFTVTAVDGATTYYAIYTGSSDFSNIVFNHATATFSGANAADLESNRSTWYSGDLSGRSLTMAGKSSGDNMSMKPCLALAKFRVGATSVASKYADGYSGVRGFIFYQDPNASYGGDTPYPSGDYTVDLSGESMVITPVVNSNRRNYKNVSRSSSLLVSGQDYYFDFLPGGAINGFKLSILGFDSEGNASDGTQYTYTLNQAMTVDPGDFFNLGTLDPVGDKKAEASFSDYAININGAFSQWDAVSTGMTGTNFISFKVTYDKYYVYLYSKIVTTNPPTRFAWSNEAVYIWYGFDIDNNSETGKIMFDTARLGKFETRFVAYPFGGGETPTVYTTPKAYINGTKLSSGTVACSGNIGDGVVETQMRVPRKSLSIFKGDVVRICAIANKDIDDLPNDGVTITFAN